MGKVNRRIRTIKPELFRHDIVARYPFGCRWLFVSLISMADDFGSTALSVREIIAFSFPHDDGENSEEIEIDSRMIREWIAKIHEDGLVEVYHVGGIRYLHLSGWATNQKIDRPNSERSNPPYPGDGVVPKGLIFSADKAFREWIANDSRENRETIVAKTASGSGIRDQGSGIRERTPNARATMPEPRTTLAEAIRDANMGGIANPDYSEGRRLHEQYNKHRASNIPWNACSSTFIGAVMWAREIGEIDVEQLLALIDWAATPGGWRKWGKGGDGFSKPERVIGASGHRVNGRDVKSHSEQIPHMLELMAQERGGPVSAVEEVVDVDEMIRKALEYQEKRR